MYRILLLLMLIPCFLISQAPEKFSFQAVVYDNQGKLMSNKNIGVHMSILSGSVDGSIVYQETFNTMTSGNGLFTIEVGNGTPTIGTMSGINWGAASHFLRREFDLEGGTNYKITGVGQMMSVPYALHSKTAESIGGLNNLDLFNLKNGRLLTFDITVGSNSFIVPNDSILFCISRTGNCGFLIDNIAYSNSNGTIIGSKRIIKKNIINSCSDLSTLKIRGYLLPKPKNFIDTIISANQFYDVPPNYELRLFQAPNAFAINDIYYNAHYSIDEYRVFFEKERLTAIPENWGIPPTQSIYLAGLLRTKE